MVPDQVNTFFQFMYVFVIYFFFFFQAEDGIRDYKVTGVQTCALPISNATSGSSFDADDAEAAPVAPQLCRSLAPGRPDRSARQRVSRRDGAGGHWCRTFGLGDDSGRATVRARRIVEARRCSGVGACLRRRGGERLSRIFPHPAGRGQAELRCLRECLWTGGGGASDPRGRRTAPPPGRGPEPLRLLVGDQTAGERRLLAARGVGVDHTLGDRLVERADGLENSGASVASRFGDGRARRLDRGPDLGANGTVADPAVLALPDSFHGRLGVRQPGTPPSSRCRHRMMPYPSRDFQDNDPRRTSAP